jgi:hypothetical protein
MQTLMKNLLLLKKHNKKKEMKGKTAGKDQKKQTKELMLDMN